MSSNPKPNLEKNTNKSDGQWGSLVKLFQFTWPNINNAHRLRLVGATIFLVLARVSSLAIPWFLGQLVGATAEKVGDVFAVMAGLVAAYASIRFLQILFTEIKDLLFVNVVQRSIRDMARSLFSNLHHQPLEFHLNRQTGGLSMAIERGTKAIEFMLVSVLFRLIPTFFELVAVCFIFWGLYGLPYALVTTVSIVVYIVFTSVVSNWRIKFRRRMNDANEASNTIAIDSLINHETIKIFSAEDQEIERFDTALNKYEKTAITSQLTLSFLNLGQAIILTAGFSGLLLLAAFDSSKSLLGAGDLATINAYMLQIFLPLGFLGTIYRIISQSLVDMEKAFNLLQMRSTMTDAPDAKVMPNGQGVVEFQKINLSLSGRKILEDISFKMPAKSTFAFVGETGSGKTTLTRILCYLLSADSGEVLIDNKNIKKFTQLSVRKQIAVVPQDVVLFNATLRTNLILGKPDATEEEITKALDDARLLLFVKKLKDGLETHVGERGLKLSGGERQRLAIARALLKEPSIMILDEATSALDVPTEKQVKKAMEQASAGRTTIVIAHRLSTVVDCDKIFVLDNGKIVESGTHNELLERNGYYAKSWKMQSRKLI